MCVSSSSTNHGEKLSGAKLILIARTYADGHSITQTTPTGRHRRYSVAIFEVVADVIIEKLCGLTRQRWAGGGKATKVNNVTARASVAGLYFAELELFERLRRRRARCRDVCFDSARAQTKKQSGQSGRVVQLTAEQRSKSTPAFVRFQTPTIAESATKNHTQQIRRTDTERKKPNQTKPKQVNKQQERR